jgi:glycosyltransferase involved in cell wall biosynthesis
MKRKTIYTFFPQYEDFHFWKDPGQIPYRFSKLGYDATIITRKNGEYPITSKFVKIKFISTKKLFGIDISLILFFLKQSKKIDVLNIFHLAKWENLLSAFVYKLFNKHGFVYLKMDNCHNSGIYPWEKIFNKNIVPVSFLASPKETLKWKIKKFFIKNIFIKKIDLFSVEDVESKEYFENKYDVFKNKLLVAYNGHTIDFVNKNIKIKSFEEKENLIITVGRLGTFPKNTFNLLKGFALTAKMHNWQLELAGPIDPQFVADKDKFYKANPTLENRIKFVGNLEKTELFDLYNRAKIFLLPSNFEGFAIVYSEAAFFGNAIITSAYTSVKNIVTESKLGLLAEPESPQEIGDAIMQLILNEERTKRMSQNSRDFALVNLNWDKIVEMIQTEIDKRDYDTKSL